MIVGMTLLKTFWRRIPSRTIRILLSRTAPRITNCNLQSVQAARIDSLKYSVAESFLERQVGIVETNIRTLSDNLQKLPKRMLRKRRK